MQVNAEESGQSHHASVEVENILGVKRFDEVVRSSKLPLYVLFLAPYDRCPLCEEAQKLLHSVAPGFAARASFATVNIIYHMPLAKQYDIKHVPYLIMFRDGKLVTSATASALQAMSADTLQKYIASTLQRKPTHPAGPVTMARVDVAKFNTFAYEKFVVNEKKPVLINVSSSQSWCGPCREAEKIIRDVLAQHDDPLCYLFIDIGESTNNILRLVTVMPELERRILGVPTLLFYKDGQLLEMKMSIPDKQDLRAALQIFKTKNTDQPAE